MTGAKESVLGVIPQVALDLFLERAKLKVEIPESGSAIVNALLVEVDGNKPIKIQRLSKVVEV
jgi:calcineurin-like phosphoesterase